jgi:hypothetical protein
MKVIDAIYTPPALLFSRLSANLGNTRVNLLRRHAHWLNFCHVGVCMSTERLDMAGTMQINMIYTLWEVEDCLFMLEDRCLR